MTATQLVIGLFLLVLGVACMGYVLVLAQTHIPDVNEPPSGGKHADDV